MEYSETLMLSDDIADSVQIELSNNKNIVKINENIFQLESLRYKNNILKEIKIFANSDTIYSFVEDKDFTLSLIVNEKIVELFNKKDIEELQIDKISKNCSIIINLAG